MIYESKCLQCPYQLGLIKCMKDPCSACLASRRASHPFPVPVQKSDNGRCPYCGGRLPANGRCMKCKT